MLNIFEQSFLVEAVVWWHAFNQLVDHDSQKVPVQRETMSFSTS